MFLLAFLKPAQIAQSAILPEIFPSYVAQKAEFEAVYSLLY